MTRQLTMQEAFNYAKYFLLRQNKMSVNAVGGAYFGKNCRCGIGCFIPDKFKNLLEIQMNRPVDGLSKQVITESGLLDLFRQNRHFLPRLQLIHDRHPPTEWLSQFAQTAESWNLIDTPLENCRAIFQEIAPSRGIEL